MRSRARGEKVSMVTKPLSGGGQYVACVSKDGDVRTVKEKRKEVK